MDDQVQPKHPDTAPPKHEGDKKHELKVARMTALTGALFLALTSVFTGWCTIQAAHITAKTNPDQSGGFIQNMQNIYYGFKTIDRLGNPEIPLSQVLPTPALSTSSITVTPTPEASKVSVALAESQAQEAAAIDPKVLDSCVGLSPLSLQKVFVESIGNGFNLTFRVNNPTKKDISLYVDGSRSLNDSAQHDYGAGSTNLPGTVYGTYNDMVRAFNEGMQIDAGDSGSMNFTFRGIESKADTVSVQVNFDLVIKGDGEQAGVKKTTLSCSALPVIRILAAR